MEEHDNPFVVLKLEEDACDAGHSTLSVHGDSEIVAAVAAGVALMLAALAEEVGGELFDPRELAEDEPESDIAESA